MRSFFACARNRGLALLALPLALAGAARADEVTDWHEHMLVALGKGGGQFPGRQPRRGARLGGGVRCGQRHRTPVRADPCPGRRSPRRFQAGRGRSGGLRGPARPVPGASGRPERQAGRIAGGHRGWGAIHAARRGVGTTRRRRHPRRGGAPMASHRRRPPISAESKLGRWRPTPPAFLRRQRCRNSPP